jgi:tRNA-(ms[2]io[6]A)-hydroxylase
MAEPDLPVTPALKPTPERWLAAVLDQFDEFLKDHASCEKKASGMAMNVAAHYPDQPRLLEAMVDLAVEELNHYREVVRLLLARDIAPGPDRKDPYIHALNHLIRRGSETFLLDRLLVGAVVERRGAERFGLIAAALDEPKLKDFYSAITASEQRHWTLFLDLAKDFYPEQSVWTRFYELSEAEAEIMLAQPALPALH